MGVAISYMCPARVPSRSHLQPEVEKCDANLWEVFWSCRVLCPRKLRERPFARKRISSLNRRRLDISLRHGVAE
jgi:hypothetical protein